MNPNRDRIIKLIKQILLILVGIWLVVAHPVFVLILTGILLIVALVVVNYLPQIIEFIEDFFDNFKR